MLSISTGYSVDYLLNEIVEGRENYYTGAVSAGEPPGRWYGTGAAKLGLSGLVDPQDMRAVFERFVDPRDELFKDSLRWAEASTLGHTGRKYPTADELYAAALDAEPGATAERREQLRLDANKSARRNVPFLDVTFSVQKSVTVLHTAFEAQQVNADRTAGRLTAALDAATSTGADAGELAELARQRDDARIAAESWKTHRDAVEDAIWAGNRAALDYLAEHAGYARVGHHGGAAGRFIDAHDLIVASFLQHDSRNHDPQLHIHNPILNRVQGSDGKWRTLDSKALHKFRGAAAAVAERTTEEHLGRALGVRFATRPDGKAREVVGMDQRAMDLFSSRRRAVTKKTATLVAQFETRFGREPNSLELDRLQRQATLATRKAKSHDGETAEARLARWDRELRTEVADGLAGVSRDVLAMTHGPQEPAEWSPEAVLKTALADVQSAKAGWTAPDLTRAISDALPDQLGDLDGAQVARLLDTLTAEGVQLATPLAPARPGTATLPAALTLADGRSAYDAPAGQLYATPDHVRTERALLAATARGGAPALEGAAVDEFVAGLAELNIVLGADQAAAVRGVLTSGAAVESLVGPAGTGKSFVVGALAKAWGAPGLWNGTERRVFGLAASQVATDVLAGEGLTARNIARWLTAQERLEGGSTHPDHEPWRLTTGDLVVVDESAMANTADLAKIHHHVERAGAKLLLTGDHQQLAAVGAGGGMDMMAEAGAAYELSEVRRFDAAWEREASLRLRQGDESVLGEYHKHGRLIDAGTREQAERAAGNAWLADTLAGRRSILVVDTNEQAAQLSAELRNELIRLGKVFEGGVPLGMQGTYAGRNDVVQARKNGWDLAGFEGNREVPINRQRYRVLATREDGGLVVARIIGQDAAVGEVLADAIALPGSYVDEHMTLDYATTAHAAQGLTVDTSHAVVTETSAQRALYVGLTRGREHNAAYVTTLAVPADAPEGAALKAVKRTPAAVLAGAFESSTPQRSALQAATEATANAEAIRTPAELLADATELATAGRTARWLDELTEEGKLSDNQRARIAAEDGASTLARLLRRTELAGHDPRRVLEDAVSARDFAGARDVSNVIHHRISAAVTLDPVGDSYTDRLPQLSDPQWATYLRELAGAADARNHELGQQLTEQPQQWAIEALGPVPADPVERKEWSRHAGIVAAHRELTGHDDEANALGAPPKSGQVEAYASWRAAWRALGRPESGRDELEMTDGQLLVRARAWEREKAWGPQFVGNELAGTHQARDRYRRDATLRRAEADVAGDQTERARLLAEAADAEALATVIEQRVGELQAADEARAVWYAHTAETRAAADRASAELSARNVDGAPVAMVTAEEWLDVHRTHEAAADADREVADEHELADVARQREANIRTATLSTIPWPAADLDVAQWPTIDTDVDTGEAAAETADAAEDSGTADAGELIQDPPKRESVVETEVADVREVAGAEEPVVEYDELRVPSAPESAEMIERAQRALREVGARAAAEEREAREYAQATEMHRRNEIDAAGEAEQADDSAAYAR